MTAVKKKLAKREEEEADEEDFENKPKAGGAWQLLCQISRTVCVVRIQRVWRR